MASFVSKGLNGEKDWIYSLRLERITSGEAEFNDTFSSFIEGNYNTNTC